jgi:hypothetical protein
VLTMPSVSAHPHRSGRPVRRIGHAVRIGLVKHGLGFANSTHDQRPVMRLSKAAL